MPIAEDPETRMSLRLFRNAVLREACPPRFAVLCWTIHVAYQAVDLPAKALLAHLSN
jgi:hypothetical protein